VGPLCNRNAARLVEGLNMYLREQPMSPVIWMVDRVARDIEVAFALEDIVP
jgi:hypothetical protein